MRDMAENETQMVLQLRNADIPHAMRGFQEEATKKLLDEAAGVLERVIRERDSAREEAGRTAAVAAPQDDTSQTEAIGRALVTATSLSEQIVASAEEKAEHLVAEAQAEADRRLADARAAVEQIQRETEGQRLHLDATREEVLAKARVEAEQIVRDAHAEVARLREESAGLRATLQTRTAAVIEAARAALERVEALAGPSQPEPGELLTDLQPAEPATAEAAPEPAAPEPAPRASA